MEGDLSSLPWYCNGYRSFGQITSRVCFFLTAGLFGVSSFRGRHEQRLLWTSQTVWHAEICFLLFVLRTKGPCECFSRYIKLAQSRARIFNLECYHILPCYCWARVLLAGALFPVLGIVTKTSGKRRDPPRPKVTTTRSKIVIMQVSSGTLQRTPTSASGPARTWWIICHLPDAASHALHAEIQVRFPSRARWNAYSLVRPQASSTFRNWSEDRYGYLCWREN